METSIQEYSQTAAALADLSSRFKGAVYDVSTEVGMGDAKKARNEIRGYRIGLEEKRVEIKSPALERCRLIDAEAKRITFELNALEDPIVAQINKEEGRKEAEKQAAIRAEQEKIEGEQRAIKAAEEARMKAEREEISRRQAELDKQEREQRDKIRAEEDRLRVEREKIEKAKRAEEDRKREEEYKKQEAARKARWAEEEKQRAAQKAENDKTDARGMLASFVERYGKIKEFAEVVKAIRAYQKGAR